MKITPRKLMASLPDSIRVGAFDFRIEQWNAHEAAGAHRYGECSSVEHTIRIQDDFVNIPKAVDTFLHEVLHAVWHSWGVEDKDEQERTVGSLSTGLTALYRDNPWLLSWLQRALA